MIPRLIHQTVPDKTAIADEFLENIKNIKGLNAGYTHILYDNEDQKAIIREKMGPTIYGYYERINPTYGVARTDFFKYLLMYMEGGVYLDIKSTASRPLDEVLTSPQYHLSQWRNAPGERYAGWGSYKDVGITSEYQQWHIIAPPRHPFLKAVIAKVMQNIDCYQPDIHGTGKIGVLCTTGPIAFTLAVNPVVNNHEHRLVDITELGFRYSVFEESGELLAHQKKFDNHYSNIVSEPVILTN